MNNAKIFQVPLSKLIGVTPLFLDALTYHSIPVNWGIKREGYYMMNVFKDKAVNNFENTYEVRMFNTFMQICGNKGYNLIMIKF